MSNTVFSNYVLESKATDLLATKVSARSLMTVDASLAEVAGMKKTINTYTYTGAAEALAMGAASTQTGSITYTGVDYDVNRLQQKFSYYDEEAMKDDNIVDFMMEGASQIMANKLTDDFYTAIATTTTVHAVTGAISYDAVVDGISRLNVEDESKLFLLISPSQRGAIRKDADYKTAQLGDVIYNGMVGTIAGIPVIVSKAVPDKVAYIASADAVRCFMKKDVTIEQDRDFDTNRNDVYLKTYYIVALVDATKACKITFTTSDKVTA